MPAAAPWAFSSPCCRSSAATPSPSCWRLFGVGSVKNTANINFVIQLETYDPEKVYDRIGLEEETTNILGMKVPAATIPVQTGRNLAVIIEVATMNYRQRAMGNNSAKELMEQLGLTDDVQP